ncbi:hypothetical protein COU60_00045 [Candidatus Pacearchaeota archaeon CG10_big_fil_rev_8_21_14_0_10_34_76]|nr:MAG: hypothetical protein COU60_00045 [Candidatus Pacearchaeota archaeon CG10_big_fil_rev_8_21_14_0_10_34_76]
MTINPYPTKGCFSERSVELPNSLYRVSVWKPDLDSEDSVHGTSRVLHYSANDVAELRNLVEGQGHVIKDPKKDITREGGTELSPGGPYTREQISGE